VFQPYEAAQGELATVKEQTMAKSFARTWFHEECEAAINEQINIEYTISYVYHSLYNFFDRDNVGLPGFAQFFKSAAEEERQHAELLMAYQTKRGGRVKLQVRALSSRCGRRRAGRTAPVSRRLSTGTLSVWRPPLIGAWQPGLCTVCYGTLPPRLCQHYGPYSSGCRIVCAHAMQGMCGQRVHHFFSLVRQWHATSHTSNCSVQALAQPMMEYDNEEKGEALYSMELALSLEKLNFQKLRALHQVAAKHDDAALCDFVESHLLEDQARGRCCRCPVFADPSQCLQGRC
jgi:ferritin